MAQFIGIDVGSVGTKLVVLEESEEVCARLNLPTRADPLSAITSGLKTLRDRIDGVAGVGVTGSGKELAGLAVGADLVKNEISAHALAAVKVCPQARTVIEIGGQDSKIIVLEDGLISDFAMNSVCAAGTGSFLAQQASRLGISLEELGALALSAPRELAVAARCTVFAESDMIYKQQLGYPTSEIVYGLCVSLARNYLNTLGRGRRFDPPFVFQGGVAANLGMRRAFEEVLGQPLVVPEEYFYTGAIGAALFAARQRSTYGETAFSWDNLDRDLSVGTFVCDDCENRCSVVRYLRDGDVLGYRGDLCAKYTRGEEQPADQ